MSFIQSLKEQTDLTTTENGATVYSTTDNTLLDLFARIGGLRNASANEITNLYIAARNFDKELTDNLILYTRDIRNGGLGERRISQILLKTLAVIDPAKVRRNFQTIVDCGRWDDLFIFEGTKLENEMMDFIKQQLRKDLINYTQNKEISLLAKWLPSINASSKETRRLARKFCVYFDMSERTYRKNLSALRKYLKIVERKMAAKKFDQIDYSTVPSKAMLKYRSAFRRQDGERFQNFLDDVSEGKTKINSSTLYPYEIIRPYLYSAPFDAVLEEQWKHLPNYLQKSFNVVCMSDVSGSMYCDNDRPMATSLGLGLYFAQHNTGEYANLLMTFSSSPHFYKIESNATVWENIRRIKEHVGFNTDLDKAMETLYNFAERGKESPEALIIISDMEIDDMARDAESTSKSFETIAEKWDRKYKEIGLKTPKLICWNVESRGGRFFAKRNSPLVSYVSGSSAGTFRELLTLIEYGSEAAMVKILSNPCYAWK